MESFIPLRVSLYFSDFFFFLKYLLISLFLSHNGLTDTRGVAGRVSHRLNRSLWRSHILRCVYFTSDCHVLVNEVYLQHAVGTFLSVSPMQASLRPGKSRRGRSRSRRVMKNVASWMKTSWPTRRRSSIGQVAEEATEPWTKGRTPMEEGGVGSQTGTKLRSTSNQLEPIATFMKVEVEIERWSSVWSQNTITCRCGGLWSRRLGGEEGGDYFLTVYHTWTYFEERLLSRKSQHVSQC